MEILNLLTIFKKIKYLKNVNKDRYKLSQKKEKRANLFDRPSP